MWFARGEKTRSDDFDRYLDAVVQRTTVLDGTVDPGLVAATRHVHGLAATNQPSRQVMASVWEAVMDATRAPRPKSQPVIGLDPIWARQANPVEPATSFVPWSSSDRRWRMGSRLANVAMLLTLLAVGYVVIQTAFRQSTDDRANLGVVSSTPGLAGECRVEPRTIEDVVSVLSTPAASRPLPTSDLEAGVAPEVVSAIQTTQAEWNACGRIGEVMRQVALETDAHIRQDPRFDLWGGLDPDEIQILVEAEVTRVAGRAQATPSPIPSLGGETLVIHAEDARQLPDGRVGALLREESPDGGITAPLPFNTFRIFVLVGDRWLIDQDIMAGG